MKIVGEYLSDGKVVVIPQDSDDLYYIYNTLAPGDHVQAKTSRKVKRNDMGMEDTQRISVYMELRVEEVEFHGFGDSIRVRGIITNASDDSISLGSYHSITIELYKKLTIIKSSWEDSELKRLRDAQMGKSSPLVVIAIDDQSALISQVGTHASKILLDLEPAIPRKGSDPIQHRKATKDFFDEIATFLRHQRELGIAQYIVVGGPGFTKDAFYEHLKINHRDLLENLQIVNTKTSGRSGVREIINEKIPSNFAAGQEAKKQAILIQEVLETMSTNPDLIAYGKHISNAIEYGAVEKLLVLDTEMHDTVEKRKSIEQLMTKVQQKGGECILMSSMHDSGEILNGLGGMVALLRFPLPK